MASSTLQYYKNNAQAFTESTMQVDMSPVYEKFLPLVSNGGHILDAGCGPGRDALQFKSIGYEVTAMDASPELIEFATRNLGQPAILKTFDEIDWEDRFDGVWCCASLLHVPRKELNSIFQKIFKSLKYGGAFYYSFKYGSQEREVEGRRFTDMNESLQEELLSNFPNFQISESWLSHDQRPGRKLEQWINTVIVKV